MIELLFVRRRRPGETLTLLIWFRALCPSGRLPTPTVERVNQLKRLVAGWKGEKEAEPDDE